MPRGSFEIPLPSSPGGLREDISITDIPLGSWLTSSNALVRQGATRPRPGYTQIGTMDGGRVLGIGFRGSPKDFYSLVVFTEETSTGYISGTETDITGTWATSTADYPVRSAMFTSGGTTYLCRTNLLNEMHLWSGTGSFAEPSGSNPNAPAALDIAVANNRVILVHTDDGTRNPYQVRWSEFGDPNDWPTGTGYSAELSDTNDVIVAVSALTPLAVTVFKEETIWLAQATANRVPFQFQLVDTVPGPISAACVVNYRGAQYWLAHDGVIYRFDGTRAQPVTGGAARTFLSLFDWEFRIRSHGFSLSLEEPEIWWFYPQREDHTVVRALALNLATGAITPHVFQDELAASATWVGLQSEVVWDTEPASTWSGMTYTSWAELLALPIHPVSAMGGGSGEVWQFGIAADDDGTDIAWSFTHPWRKDPQSRRMVLDGVVSYWDHEDSSVPVTVAVTATDTLGGEDVAVERTYDLEIDDNHVASFGDVWGRFFKVQQSGDAATTTTRYRGGMLMGWPRGFV